MELHEPRIETDGGPWAIHDQACPVCRKNTAVLDLDGWVFHPCWSCQKDGWDTVRRSRLHRFFRRGRP